MIKQIHEFVTFAVFYLQVIIADTFGILTENSEHSWLLTKNYFGLSANKIRNLPYYKHNFKNYSSLEFDLRI